METSLQRITFPELFFGFVSPIGADIEAALIAFERELRSKGYEVVRVKVTNIYKIMKDYVPPNKPLNEASPHSRYSSFIEYGNQLREHFDDDAVLAATAMRQIANKRIKSQANRVPYERTAYLIHQFKRKEEIDLLRSVYGRLFFQISIYSRRGARTDFLSRVFARGAQVSGPQRFRHLAEKIIQDDEDEVGKKHGQRVAKIFHDADFIISRDIAVPVDAQVSRFVDLLFGANYLSPSRLEYGMFVAKAAALRTLDLSRQVGAAIFSNETEIISLGSNEVPKAEGGTYWEGDPHDAREYAKGGDSNLQRKREILTEIIRITHGEGGVEPWLGSEPIRESQFMDALEYGRIIHAEMSAIMDAARLGRSVKGATLFCTTFPCHMCAKHIVGAGIKNVVFLEPYPKSLAFDLHADSLEIEGGDRGQYRDYPSTGFEHFYGVTPRRYRELFERGSRRTSDGEFMRYIANPPRPIIAFTFPFYQALEEDVFSRSGEVLGSLGDPD